MRLLPSAAAAGLITALSLLAACHPQQPPSANSLDAMDKELVNGAAMEETAAGKDLAAAIRVDPARIAARAVRRQPASQVAVAPARPPRTPQEDRQAGADAAASGHAEGSPVDGGAGCLAGLAYGNGWAAKLPADLPLHPSARLQEAAGHDGACQARIVSFTVPGDRGRTLDWYRRKAQAAGYATGRADRGGDWILAGDRGRTRFYLIFGPATGGATPVDYVWTNGD